MSFLLDTNVISELTKKKPDAHVTAWLNKTPANALFISVLSLGEIRKGIEKVIDTNKKNHLIHWLEFDLPTWFQDRVLKIDTDVADRWGRLQAETSRSLPAIDSLLAYFILWRKYRRFNPK